jgi:hypothetical protein
VLDNQWSGRKKSNSRDYSNAALASHSASAFINGIITVNDDRLLFGVFGKQIDVFCE